MSAGSPPVVAVTTSARSGWRIFPLVALNLWLAGGRARRWGAGRAADLDAYAAFPGSRRYRTILPRRRIRALPGTRLAAITGREEMRVNALHSQAVDALGSGLRVAARDGGGMIQAIERGAAPFALGVQWHPEHLFYHRAQRQIFAALVEAARSARADPAPLGVRAGGGRGSPDGTEPALGR